MRREESFIAMKLIWHGYLILNLGIFAYETSIETGIKFALFWDEGSIVLS